MAWVYLSLAILSELSGTIALRRATDGVTSPVVAIIVVSYAAAFALMALTLRQLNVGVVYAVWSAAGTALIAVAGVVLFGERLNMQAVIGLIVVVAGVMLLVTSGSVRHG